MLKIAFNSLSSSFTYIKIVSTINITFNDLKTQKSKDDYKTSKMKYYL